MPLVWENIVRFSVVGRYSGQLMVNVFDVELIGSDAPGRTRADDAYLVAGDILNNWTDHVLGLMTQEYEAREVRWVDLDSLSGSTGSRSSTDTNTWPMAGTNTGTGFPGNVYARVIKQLEGKGRQARNGITRLGAVPENVTGGTNVNVITLAGYVDAVNTAFEDFKDGINGQNTFGETRNLGVLHTRNNSATGFSRITDFALDTRLGTLRRRMPGYGD